MGGGRWCAPVGWKVKVGNRLRSVSFNPLILYQKQLKSFKNFTNYSLSGGEFFKNIEKFRLRAGVAKLRLRAGVAKLRHVAKFRGESKNSFLETGPVEFCDFFVYYVH